MSWGLWGIGVPGPGERTAAVSEDDLSDYWWGQCGTFAVAHQRQFPHLRFGIDWQRIGPEDDPEEWEACMDGADPDVSDDQVFWQPQHIFTHDDTHSYDAQGSVPLAGRGSSGWNDTTLNHSLDDILNLGTKTLAGKHPHPESRGMVDFDKMPSPEVVRKFQPHHTAHRTAMPTPMPEGITFHYHPTDETTPPTIFAPAIEARHDGKTVGKLEWFGPHESNPNLPHGEINMVEVHPDYRRHNIATTMFDHARRIDPAVKHSPGKTGPGRAWAEYEQSRNKKARTMTAAVTVYTKPSCPQCDMTKKLLDRLGVEHDTVDVTADPEAHAYVTGLGYQAAPVVVVNGGEAHWTGFRPDHLKGLAQ